MADFDRFGQDYVYDDRDATNRKIVGFETTSYADRTKAESSLVNLIKAFIPR